MSVASAEVLLLLMPLAAACSILLGRQQQRLAVFKREAADMQRTIAELQAMLDRAPLGLVMVDRELRFVHINQLLADFNGAPVADHIGKTLYDMAPSIALAAVDRMRHVLDTGVPSTHLMYNSTSAAQPNVMSTWRESIVPLLDRTRKAQANVISLEDITEQQRLADELRVSRQNEQRRGRELECVLHVCPTGVLIATDRACLRVKANPAAERLLRLERGANASMSAPIAPAFTLHADGREVMADGSPLRRAAALGEETWDAGLTVRFADGDTLDILVNAMPLHDEHGMVVGAVAAFAEVRTTTVPTMPA